MHPFGRRHGQQCRDLRLQSAQIADAGNGDTIQACYVGTTFGGKARGSTESGVGIEVGGSSNLIQDNVISGLTGFAGLYLLGGGSTQNTILNNFIGTDGTGNTPIPNLESGIIVQFGANNNAIAQNLISANKVDGIDIGGVGTSNNKVYDNRIGTNMGGTSGGNLGNGRDGVDIYGGATNNIIGGPFNTFGSPTGGNLISNNGADGVSIFDSDAHVTQGNKLEGNYIGTDITGTKALHNHGNGVSIVNGAEANYVGYLAAQGDNHLYRNLISGNTKSGVLVGVNNPKATPASDNTVEANFIGTDNTGAVPGFAGRRPATTRWPTSTASISTAA